MNDYKVKYENALKFLSSIYPIMNDYTKTEMINRFPELDLVRQDLLKKAAIDFINSSQISAINGIGKSEVLQWLNSINHESSGLNKLDTNNESETKPVVDDTYCKFKVGDQVIIHCKFDRDDNTKNLYDNQIGKVLHVWSLDNNPWGNIVVILDNYCQNGFLEEELELVK